MLSVIKKACREFNSRRPEVVVVVHEMDQEIGALADTVAGRVVDGSSPRGSAPSGQGGGRGRGRGPGPGQPKRMPVAGRARRAPPAQKLPPGMVKARQAANPRENPDPNADPKDLTYG